MVKTRYFAANTLAGFFRTGSSVADGYTTAGYFDTDYVQSCINIPAGMFIHTPEFLANDTQFQLRWDSRFGAPNTSQYTMLSLYDGSTERFRVTRSAGSNSYRLDFHNGSSWVNGSLASATTALNTLVLKIEFGVAMTLYSAGTELLTVDLATSPATQITSFRFGSDGANNYLSQIMAANYDLRDAHLMAAPLNAVSASNTAGSGAVGDINESVLAEATAAKLTASADKRGFTHSGITLPIGYQISAMVVAARGRRTGTITDGKLGVRSGGANYSSAALGYNEGYEPRLHISPTDPDTGVPFTESGFNAAEIYAEAA